MDPNLNLDSEGGLPPELLNIRRAKEELVAKDGIGADVPTVAILERDGHKIGGIACGRLCKYHWSAAVAGTIAATRATAVMLCGETFLGPCDSPDEADGLDKRFAQGDNSVSEGIYLTVASARDINVLAMPYRYEGRRIEWGEVDVEIHEDPFLSSAMFVAFSLRPLPVRALTVPKVAKRYGIPWVDLAGRVHKTKAKAGFCGS